MNHHHHQRSLRVSLPPRQTRPYQPFPSLLLTPTPTATPSKHRRSFSQSTTNGPLFLITFLSIFSLYTLHPFLNASASLSLLPFSFLLTFISSLILSLFPSSPERPSFSTALFRPLAAKGILLSLVFLLRFQSLHIAGPAATVLADFAGSLAAKSVATNRDGRRRIHGIASLLSALLVLSFGWDRVGCFPSSFMNLWNSGSFQCFGVLRIVCPFTSGFLGYLERSNWGSLNQLGRKPARLYSLWSASAFLFPFAFVSWLQGNWGADGISFVGLIWPLFSSILFGVILNEFYGEERSGGSSQRVSEREFFILLSCTCVLELFYFSEFSLFGFVLVSFALWVSVNWLGYDLSRSPQLGSDDSGSFFSAVMSPIRHILSERKSRKIALFLLINTVYMSIEFTVGFMSNSLGLISDACHMLFDCAALAIGLYASYISRLPGNSQFNYGRGRFEVLSGYVNAVLLVLVGALIVVESLERILDPQEISTSSLLTVSIGGLLVNLVGLVFFHEEHHHAHGGSAPCSHSDAHHSYSHANYHLHKRDHACSHKREQHGDCSHDHHEDDHKNQGANSHLHKHDHACSHKHEQHGNCSHDHHEDVHKNQGACGLNSNHHHDHRGSHQHQHQHQSSSDLRDACCAKDLSCSEKRGHSDSSYPVHEEDNHMVSHSQSISQCCLENCIQVQPDSHSRSCSVRNCSHRDSNRKPQKEPKKHNHIDHNMEGIFLHVLADTMGSLGVVISTLLIKYKGWLVADPACSIFISVMIVSSVLPLLRNSAEILLQRVPRLHEQELKEALNDIVQIKGVYDIQNLHVWSLTNTDIVGTLHLHVSAENNGVAKEQVAHILHNAGINDLTLQLEYVSK